MSEITAAQRLRERVEREREFFRDALCRYEGRSISEVEIAAAVLAIRFSADALVDEWDRFHRLQLEAGASANSSWFELLLGVADPAWQMGEVYAIAGYALLEEAACLMERGADVERVALLLVGAVQAKLKWEKWRGLWRSRYPNPEAVTVAREFDEKIFHLQFNRNSKAAADRRHQNNRAAREWVQAEWRQHRNGYMGNKSAFALDYSKRLRNERSVMVKERQIREVWLKG